METPTWARFNAPTSFVPSPHSLSPSALSGEGTQEDSELEDGDVLPSGGGLEDEPLLSRDHVAVV